MACIIAYGALFQVAYSEDKNVFRLLMCFRIQEQIVLTL